MSLKLSLKCQRFSYSPYFVNCIFESVNLFVKYYMMRKTLKKIMLVVIAATIISVINFENPKQFSSLTLNNIEALASGEGEPNIYCIGTGSIDCEGRKVLTKYNPLSLDYTE